MKTIGSVKRKSNALATLVGVSISLTLFGCDETETKTDFNAVDTNQVVSTSQVATESSISSDWQMVWNDEFDGDAIDLNKWFHEVNCAGGGNDENQCYTDNAKNSFVADGILNIVALPAEDTTEKDYTSANLSTKNLGDFKYGRFEIRAKMPFGQGTWPAIWMLPTDDVYGGWPNSGEIDIVEAVNLKTINDEGVTESYVHGTLHYGKDWPKNAESGKSYLLPNGINPADGFHTYAIEWQEGEIRWYVDGYLFQTQMASTIKYNSKDQAVGLRHRGWFTEYYDIISGELETHWDASPFDQDFHLLLNLAVGGDWAGNVNDGGIDPAAFANGQTLAIDYVRVYECSANPDTGKGCETIRSGYKDADDALVIGAAPIPRPPSTGIAVNLTIFDTTENPSWPIWGDNGEIDPTIQTDDEDHGEVVEFSIGDVNTVMGFNVFESDAPLGFDAFPMIATGNVTFDMKVVSPPSNASAVWNFKIESNGADEEANFFLNESIEGLEPVVGEWQTYTFSLQSIADQGVDLTNIDVLMLFPTWGSGSGAVYRVDNVKIAQEGTPGADEPGEDNTLAPGTLFADATASGWVVWDCCGGTTPTLEVDDADHNVTAEFTIASTPTVMGFNTRSGIEGGGDANFDASALLSAGVVQFEMKVITPPADPSSYWLFKIENSGGPDNGGAAVEIALTDSNEGAVPVTGQWQTYTFSLSDLANAGLDISDIDVVMIFPLWDTGDGAVYRVDNLKIANP